MLVITSLTIAALIVGVPTALGVPAVTLALWSLAFAALLLVSLMIYNVVLDR